MVHKWLFLVVALVTLGFVATPALADHGLGHNGETMELSASENLADGEEVTVSLSSFLPGGQATVVTCFVFPALGPADCELSNYGTYVATVADDGTASLTYPVAWVDGRCDPDNPCFVVAGDGFGPDANYAGVAITFGDGSATADSGSAGDEGASGEAEETTEEPSTPAEEEELANTGASSAVLVGAALALLALGLLLTNVSARARRA